MQQADEGTRRNVPELNALVRALVEQETLGYPFWVGGVVTRFFSSHLGHLYFDLNDDDYSIGCMIREKIRGTIDFNISNGIEIEVYGTIRVYDKKAQVQIEVEKARLIERPPFVIDATVQEQLAQKGLWPKTKHPLPTSIKKIGIITSKHSEALHDFRETYHSEGGQAETKLADVRIQGEQAARDISEAIRQFNGAKSVDVIALIRGGGRAAELAVFNDLVIAEAICSSTIPVVTGIGHQQDNTFADQVADVSLITPSIAAIHLARATQSTAAPQAVPQPQQQRMIWILSVIAVAAIIMVFILLLRPG